MENDGEMSLVGGMMVLLSTGIGTGVLVLPKAMAAVGYAPMVGALVLGSLVSAFTTWILFLAVARYRRASLREACLNDKLLETDPKIRPRLDSDFVGAAIQTNGCDSCSYSDLLAVALPPWSSVVLDVALIIYGIGACTTYFLFVSNFVHKFDFWPSELTQNRTIVLMGFVVFPLTLPSSVAGLARLAPISSIALVLMVVGIWIREPEASASRTAPVEAFADLQRMPAVCCICIYAFMWHTNCVGVARELNNPTSTRCAIVALGGATLLGLVYACIAFGGYLSWGENLLHANSVVEMYSNDDPLFIVIRVALTCGLMVGTPLNYYPVRESCAGLVRFFKPDYTLSATHRVLWGGSLVVFSVFIAIEFPDVVKIITTLGGTLAAFVMIIFPACIAKVVFSPKMWLLSLVLCLALGLFLNLAACGIIGKPA